jgi:REP element-mobilizing transposase RayT
VTGHSVPARAAFADDTARRGFLALLAGTSSSSDWLVLAYSLLTTHYHLLVQTLAANLSVGMKRIHGRHAQLVNARQGTPGPLWRDRFHSAVVETESHVVEAAAYIDANPVDAGVCRDPSEWDWSSYRANAVLAPGPAWHHPDVLHSFLGASAEEAPAVYRDVVAQAIERAQLRRWAQRIT